MTNGFKRRKARFHMHFKFPDESESEQVKSGAGIRTGGHHTPIPREITYRTHP